jgi:transcriptional regulator with XRE-family HTH domain
MRRLVRVAWGSGHVAHDVLKPGDGCSQDRQLSSLVLRPELATGRRTLGNMAMSVARSLTTNRASRGWVQDVDRHVGARLRERRIMLGLTQQQMAALIGVTYQQTHKYETGLNRISAGRLYQLAQALGVPIGYFFNGLTTAPGAVTASPQQRRMLELTRHFMAIADRRHQEAICNLGRSLANRDLVEDLELDPAIEDRATAA